MDINCGMPQFPATFSEPNCCGMPHRTPTLTAQHLVACHSATPPSSTPNAVACHTERVAIQEKLTTITRIFEPDIRAGLKLLARKEVGRISHVACHMQTPTLTPQHQPELIQLDHPPAAAPDPHIEWEYPIIDKGNSPETERRIPKSMEHLLSIDKEDIKETEDVACHTERGSTLSQTRSRKAHFFKKQKSHSPKPYYDQ